MALLDQLARQDLPADPQVPLALRDLKDRPDLLDHQAPKAPLDQLVPRVLKDLKVLPAKAFDSHQQIRQNK
jgi:hypothetical protein